MKDLILLGGGGHCKSVIEVIRSSNQYNIKGILDPGFEDGLKKVLDVPVIGKDHDIPKYIEKGFLFVITVGQIKNSSTRRKLYQEIINRGGKLPTIKANSAIVCKDVKIGEGTVVMHKAFINANSLIGNCCILNTGSSVEHDCTIGNFNHISTNVVLNGQVFCGNDNFIGSGTIVNQGVQIGNKNIVASGSVIRKDLKNNTFVAGNPLKFIK